MIREWPWLDPRSWTGVKRSSPSTRLPRLASSWAVALPIAPRPTTITSYPAVIAHLSSPKQRPDSFDRDLDRLLQPAGRIGRLLLLMQTLGAGNKMHWAGVVY